MSNVLLIAHAFPPSARSSGYLRTLALTRYLPHFGWQPFVLAPHPRAYERIDNDLNAEVPSQTSVTRAFALDTRRHLGIRGRYPLVLALPDRWGSWWLGAVPAGLRLIRRYRTTVIWSTSPIVTSHMIAWTLHRLTGIPWVADFRDPISATGPEGSRLGKWAPQTVERATLRYAQRCVFTTEGAAESYAQRYPACRNKLAVVPNGYDERNFRNLSHAGTDVHAFDGGTITLVHSGLLYPHGRHPRHFLTAVAMLVKRRVVSAASLQVILRASGNEQQYAAEIEQHGLADIVHLCPRLNYSEALQEQAAASGLLLFQGSPYNRQIPAKVYEYLRVGRPIFALVDRDGDTAALLYGEGVQNIAPLDDAQAIARKLELFISNLREGALCVPPLEQIVRFSREAGAQRFAELFDDIEGHGP